jgi:hypothetical protein
MFHDFITRYAGSVLAWRQDAAHVFYWVSPGNPSNSVWMIPGTED